MICTLCSDIKCIVIMIEVMYISIFVNQNCEATIVFMKSAIFGFIIYFEYNRISVFLYKICHAVESIAIMWYVV